MNGFRRLLVERRKTVALLAVALIASGAGALAYATHLLRRSELQSIDARFSIRGKQRPPAGIVLVEIDNNTLQELRRLHLRSEFPFPRAYDAQVVDHLRAAGARTIAMDMEFSHETDVSDDNALIEAVGRAHGKVVLAATEVGPGGRTSVFGGGNLPTELGARPAEARLVVDSDGAIRRFAYAYNELHSFPVVAAEVATRRAIPRSLFGGGTLPMDFAGPPGTITAVSYSSVLRGRFPQSLIRGKIAIVGASAPILQDDHVTATTGAEEEMAGPEILANATSTLLRGVPLRDASGAVNLLVIVLLGAAVPLAAIRLRRVRSLLGALALALAFILAAQVTFDSGVIVTFVYPLLALAIGVLGTLVVLYFTEAMERQRVRDVFSRFVPTGVVDEVLQSAGERLRLGGVERDCTVLFSDLRAFTTFSESHPAARVIEVVNYYLDEMSEAILQAGGTLISYMGDGILAVFGAPLQQGDHADRAFAAACEMTGPRLERFNAWLAEQGFQHCFEMGVGLNSGPVMAGNVGSEQRMEYTVIGDTANTASRLEGMTKESGAMLFVSATTRDRMGVGADQLALVGEVSIRGRVGRLAVWTPRPWTGARDDRDTQALVREEEVAPLPAAENGAEPVSAGEKGAEPVPAGEARSEPLASGDDGAVRIASGNGHHADVEAGTRTSAPDVTDRC